MSEERAGRIPHRPSQFRFVRLYLHSWKDSPPPYPNQNPPRFPSALQIRYVGENHGFFESLNNTTRCIAACILHYILHYILHSGSLACRGSAIMIPSTLEAVDPSVSLALSLDEFEQVLEVFPFVDQEERRVTIFAYEDTSQESLESFLQLLSEQVGIRKQGILRLAGLFNLIRPGASQTKPSRPNGIPSTLVGVLKATLIAGHGACGNLAIITAKLDQMSQRTIAIKGDESKITPEEVVQSLLTQLASCVVENCSRLLRSSKYPPSKGFSRSFNENRIAIRISEL